MKPPPFDRMMSLLAGRFVAQAIAAVTELGIPDRLDVGPLANDALAASIGAHAPSLYRVMRMLAMEGIFEERAGHVFALTPLGATLRSNAESSLSAMARFVGDSAHTAAWGALTEAVRTGESAFRAAHGEDPFAWLAKHPDSASGFHEAMASISSMAGPAVVAAYDFSRFGTIADVGGGHGELLAAILSANPRARGVLFDLPEVIDGARRWLAERGLAERCTIVGGDFFTAVPSGCDAYVLKNVLHNWGDAACVALLRACAAGLRDGGRVLAVEQALTPVGVPSFAKVLDVEMLVMSDGGRERSEAEYAALFQAAGLALARVVQTASPMDVLEGTKKS